jgi:phosphoribosyl-dephospho-CoA transferase
MDSLRRHRLARLRGEGWQAVLSRPWDPQARDCLTHWAAHRLPLVVTRQVVDAGDSIALGLPAPSRWQRRRLALQVPPSAVLRFEEFPALAELLDLLPLSACAAAGDLQAALASCRSTARVYGSFGWQAISGLDHVRAGSDLDVWVAVENDRHADAVAQQLRGCAMPQPRLDGELVFPDGSAVAWREWLAWRAQRTRAVLVKRLTGATLRHDASWCESGRLGALAA